MGGIDMDKPEQKETKDTKPREAGPGEIKCWKCGHVFKPTCRNVKCHACRTPLLSF